MNLRVLPAGLIRTNAYLLTDPSRGEAVLIDAPGDVWKEVAPILKAENCRLTQLWLTHGHFDHMQGGHEVVAHTNAQVLAHQADRAMIETPEVMKVFLGNEIELHPVTVDQWIDQGDRIEALGRTAEVRHVPGHCPGNVLFYFPPEAGSKWLSGGAAFTGDSLFAGSIGRTDFHGGNFATLERSIREQIYSLPETTAVYPGHGRSTTVGEERVYNPHVRG